MELAHRDPGIILRLGHGEDILESMKEAVKDEKSTCLVVSGLGMLHEFELGYFDRGNYINKFFSEPHELLSMQGSVASEGDPRVHIHVAVANTKHEAFGGHLLSGRVWMSNEIGLLRLSGLKSARSIDQEKKVGILHLENP